jgi:hypothetical protein
MSTTQISNGNASRVSAPRRTVTSATSYEAAERAVDYLSDQGFPVEHVAIVGTGLRYVENVSGRLTAGRAAVVGIGQGAMLGLLWGLLFSFFFTTTAGSFLGVLAFGVVIGIVFGGIFGAAAQYATGGRRDFASVSQTTADRYEVQVDERYAGEATVLLGRMPAR